MGVYVLCLILFCLGVYCMVSRRNIIKMIVGMTIVEYAINLFLIFVGYKIDARSPIFASDQAILPQSMVDPLPQAIVITSIVIGVATTALLAVLALRIYDKYGTYDLAEIRELKG